MDKTISLAEVELARIDWSRLRDIRSSFGERTVSAAYVPSVIKALINAKTLEGAEELETKIDNHVVVQRCLFEAAEHLVPVLIASLFEAPQGFVRNTVLILLFEIVAGFPDENELVLGNNALAERCREKAREGLWILYKLFVEDEIQASLVLDILEIIETDAARLEAFRKARGI